MSTSEDRIRARRNRLESFGAGGHPDDRFWARTPDITGVGVLRMAEQRGERLQVEVTCRRLTFYLDSTNLACVGDLYNLKDLPIGTRVGFSGNVRSLSLRGIRLGRLLLEPCDSPVEKAVLTPMRDDHAIVFGETTIPDPDPAQPTFVMDQKDDQLLLVPPAGEP